MLGRAAAYLGLGRKPATGPGGAAAALKSAAGAPTAAAAPTAAGALKAPKVRDLVKERKEKLKRDRRDVELTSARLYKAAVLNYIDFAKVLYHTSRVDTT